ncbi:LOW QUALITY PROTEIN: uncharacterized protein [Drosophila tropicalis]|uniref:LOW QUALITY PROTEIN: uncharacterized protein n=1 Tax=Drosophila tropicalis TaxID=46794 RepID=UPI0035ABBD04
MSRRKQAKPRACLKLGEKEEDENGGEICNVEDLLEPKEEMLSADESDDIEDDDNDDDDDNDNAEGKDARGEEGNDFKSMQKPNESQPKSWRTADDDAAAADTTAAVKEDGDEEVQHPGEKEVPCTTALTAPAACVVVAASVANGHCKSLSVGDVGVAENVPGCSMIEGQDDDQEDDYLTNLSDNDDEDELQSLDSFYSGKRNTEMCHRWMQHQLQQQLLLLLFLQLMLFLFLVLAHFMRS